MTELEQKVLDAAKMLATSRPWSTLFRENQTSFLIQAFDWQRFARATNAWLEEQLRREDEEFGPEDVTS